MRVLIVGCGYVGLSLGAELVGRGHEVFGMRRSREGADLTALKIRPVFADITRIEDLAQQAASYDWVVNTVSSGKGGVDAYRAVYLDGTRNLIKWLRHSPPGKFVFTSSTSVYGQTDGGWVSEASPTEPVSPTSRVLVETEQLLQRAAGAEGFPAVILRAAGIYGPNRGHLFQQYLRNEARISGDGERWMNMIHRDDLVAAVLAALQAGRPGEIYNVADDEPVTQTEFFRWLASALNGEMPPVATEAENAARKRGLTHKKVSNARMKEELGVRLMFPTFRHGYAVEIKRRLHTGEE